MVAIDVFLCMIAFSRNDKNQPAKVNILFDSLEKAKSTKIYFLSTQPFSVLVLDLWTLFI